MKSKRAKLVSKLDTVFSKYCREEAQNRCERCGKESSQVHHYFGRRKYSTRWDPHNIVVLCWACHRHWAHPYYEECRDYLISRIGQNCFDKLKLKSNQAANLKDHNLQHMISNFQKRLKELDSY